MEIKCIRRKTWVIFIAKNFTSVGKLRETFLLCCVRPFELPRYDSEAYREGCRTFLLLATSARSLNELRDVEPSIREGLWRRWQCKGVPERFSMRILMDLMERTHSFAQHISVFTQQRWVNDSPLVFWPLEMWVWIKEEHLAQLTLVEIIREIFHGVCSDARDVVVLTGI